MEDRMMIKIVAYPPEGMDLHLKRPDWCLLVWEDVFDEEILWDDLQWDMSWWWFDNNSKVHYDTVTRKIVWELSEIGE